MKTQIPAKNLRTIDFCQLPIALANLYLNLFMQCCFINSLTFHAFHAMLLVGMLLEHNRLDSYNEKLYQQHCFTERGAKLATFELKLLSLKKITLTKGT